MGYTQLSAIISLRGHLKGFKDEEEAPGRGVNLGKKEVGFSLKMPETQISKILLLQRILLKNHQLCEGVGFTCWLTAVSPTPRTMPNIEQAQERTTK